MKLTIEQLADKVNELISEKFKESPESIKDGRQSSVLSTRRIRDYITKGLVEKPVGAGREKWFDETHINKLVSLRLLQHNGLSDQYIKGEVLNNLSNSTGYHTYLSEENTLNESTSKLFDSASLNSTTNNDEQMQSNALSFLQALQNSPKEMAPKLNSKLGAIAGASNAGVALGLTGSLEKPVYAKQADLDLLRSLTQSQYRQFNEYPVDEKLGVFLKVDSKTDMVLQKKLLETLKNEIINHNKENKND
jgi:DNA-binding transcriptional MerR regulator